MWIFPLAKPSAPCILLKKSRTRDLRAPRAGNFFRHGLCGPAADVHNPLAEANRSVGGLADNLTDALGRQRPGGQRDLVDRLQRLAKSARAFTGGPPSRLFSRAYKIRRIGTRVKQDTEILHGENLPAEPLVDRLTNRSNAICFMVAHFIRGKSAVKSTGAPIRFVTASMGAPIDDHQVLNRVFGSMRLATGTRK